MGYMAEAFPTFDALIIEPTSPNALYASFLEKGRRKPILASGISDGHLQLLILLTALFSEGRDRYSLMLIDEPETSLHPWAIAILGKAIKEATEQWGKQVAIATHSPVLISQFDPNQIITVEQEDGRGLQRGMAVLDQLASTWSFQDSHWPAVSTVPAHHYNGKNTTTSSLISAAGMQSASRRISSMAEPLDCSLAVTMTPGIGSPAAARSYA